MYTIATKDILPMYISSLKRHSLLPVVAFASALLLITGQALSCCCTNEIVSEKVAEAVALLSAKLHPKVAEEASEHCTGHAMEDDEAKASDVVTAGAKHCIAAADDCISSSSLAAKVMVGSEFSSSWVLYPPIVLSHREFVTALVSSHPEPLPQNKSSPPLYLSTLHILV